MPVSTEKDFQSKIEKLENWLASKEGPLKLTPHESSLASGFSNETFVFDLKEKTSKNLSSENFDIKKIDDATFSVQANKGTNLNSIFDFFDQEGIEILSMRNETNRLEELFLKLTNNDH